MMDTMKNMRNTMDDELLLKVNGGDFGDSAYEAENHVRLHSVGDFVEVYDNWLHITTTRGEIIRMILQEMDKGPLSFDVITAPLYLVRFPDHREMWYSSNAIQS